MRIDESTIMGYSSNGHGRGDERTPIFYLESRYGPLGREPWSSRRTSQKVAMVGSLVTNSPHWPLSWCRSLYFSIVKCCLGLTASSFQSPWEQSGVASVLRTAETLHGHCSILVYVLFRFGTWWSWEWLLFLPVCVWFGVMFLIAFRIWVVYAFVIPRPNCWIAYREGWVLCNCVRKMFFVSFVSKCCLLFWVFLMGNGLSWLCGT